MSESKIICPHCGTELKVTLAEATQPAPSPEPQPEPTGRMSFAELADIFSRVLESCGYYKFDDPTDEETAGVYNYLSWVFMFADREYNNPESVYFAPETYPEVVNYHGIDMTDSALAYNAMQSWLMAMCLSELVPDSGQDINTQTELFARAWNIGGGRKVPLFSGAALRADCYVARLAAGWIYSICHSAYGWNDFADFRVELGGSPIQASDWNGLLYASHMLSDDQGRRGYKMDHLGYLVNTAFFLPSAPGPRVEGTTVTELPYPWQEGQPEDQFNTQTANYIEDETINDTMIAGWNCMAQTPLSEWLSYSLGKQNRLVNAMATIPCTYMYMFGGPQRIALALDGGELPIVDGYPRYIFEPADDGDLTIDGPFSDLAGIFRYNVHPGQETPTEDFIKTVLDIADNSRFPTQDPNYGRCRPGCACTRQGGEKNPIHGAPENELYNVSISCLVADTEEQREAWSQEDGFAADSPRSYVSGHSAQIFTMAMLLSQMEGDTERQPEWRRRAYEYSVNRSIARFHWMSDVIYGRLFATMIVPILNAMTGLRDGYESMKEQVKNGVQPSPQPQEDCVIDIEIRNRSGRRATLNGELCLVLANPDPDGVYHGWEGIYNRTGHIVFASGGIVIDDGNDVCFKNVSMANSEMVVRGRNLVAPDMVPETGYPSNVLLYDLAGVSTNFVTDPVSPNIIFEDGTKIILTI